MTKEIWIGKKGYRYWYYKFRDSQYYTFTLIGITVFVCLLLTIFIIIPQISNWFSIRNEVIVTRERIRVLNDNLSFLNTMDKNKLDSEIETMTRALPMEKDFDSILSVITDAAITSGVEMNDFSFAVGEIDAKIKKDKNNSGLDTMRVTIILTGSVQEIRNFIAQVEKSIPLAEVIALDGNDKSIALTVQFYQKGILSKPIDENQALSTLPAEKLGILQKLQTMKKPLPIILRNNNASESALPLF